MMMYVVKAAMEGGPGTLKLRPGIFNPYLSTLGGRPRSGAPRLGKIETVFEGIGGSCLVRKVLMAGQCHGWRDCTMAWQTEN